jgi:hypothetical protein
MKRRELVDLLADHADVLNDNEADAAGWVDNRVPLTAVSTLLTLLQLAQAVKRVLVPVAPSPVFRSALKTQLSQAELCGDGKRPLAKTIWVGAAVSVIGLTIYLLRRFRLAGDGVATAV